MPSRGFAEFTVTNTADLPWVTSTAPFDCLASLPVSMPTVFPSTVHCTVSILVLIPRCCVSRGRTNGDRARRLARDGRAATYGSFHVSHLSDSTPDRTRVRPHSGGNPAL